MGENSSFAKFISGARCTEKEYQEAKKYYLTTKDKKEKNRFETYSITIGSKLFKNILDNKLIQNKAFLKRRGIKEEEALSFINAYTITVKDYKLILIYWQLTHFDFLSFYYTFYKKCAVTLWRKKPLESIAKKYSISLPVLLDLVKEYKESWQQREDIDFNIILKIVDFSESFANFISNKGPLNSKATLFYELYATPEEKESFEQVKSRKNHSSNKKGNRNNNNGKYFKFCMILINEASLPEIESVVASQNINFRYLTENYILVFQKFFSEKYGADEAKKAIATILNKISTYLNSKKNPENTNLDSNIAPDSDKIMESKQIVTSAVHIKGGFRKMQTEIGSIPLITCVDIVKKYDYSLYSLYSDLASKDELITRSDLLTLIKYLTDGILENNVIRTFTILDYYLLFKIPLYKLSNYFGLLSPEEANIIEEFINKNDAPVISPTVVSNLDLKFKEQQDANGNFISCTGIVLNPHEKSQVINYLIKNDIPVTILTYKVAALRYLDGLILTDEIPALM